ncbi:MAG: MBL fold metallo-hydrolase [Proteobacteria bacterium]|nr:MBL fold metallo-hydrolase [Pseudomonadota bacterium]
MKTGLKILGILLFVLVICAAYVYSQVRAIEIERLSDDLHVLRGFGGNTAVLRTKVGAVIVDTMTFGLQGARIRQLARQLTGAEPILIINTHYHLDHTHGNPAFAEGTRVLSTTATLSHLKTLDTNFWIGDAAKFLPNETFDDRTTLQLGGKTIELVHPGPGHTDGDLVVVFVDENVIHMGDLLFQKHYPNIDLEAGGSVQKWPDTLENVMALAFNRVIPGHGATTDREGIREFQKFMQQLGAIGAKAANENWTVEEIQATGELTMDADYLPLKFIVALGIDREFVLKRAWQEATGNFQKGDGGIKN